MASKKIAALLMIAIGGTVGISNPAIAADVEFEDGFDEALNTKIWTDIRGPCVKVQSDVVRSGKAALKSEGRRQRDTKMV